MDNCKRVLIITYYWPPAATAGVHRWLKFSAKLSDFGIEPIMYVPENPTYFLTDEKLVKETEGIQVLKHKITEPYSLFKRFSGNSNINSGFISEVKKKKSWKEEFSIWIRGNFFIPDARVFWVKPSVRFLSRYLKENKIDFIISSGPPHSLHLIAMELKQKFNIPWIADFRDPWTTMDYYFKMKISSRADRKHHRLEKAVVTGADLVTVVSVQMKREFDESYGVNCKVLYGGYNDSKLVRADSAKRYEQLNIVHSGTMLKDRNPQVLWDALRELKEISPESYNFIRIRLVGRVDNFVREAIERSGITSCVEFLGTVPHDISISEQRNASILLLSIDWIENSEFVITSKIFEYLGAKRPILCIGNKTGDVADIVNKVDGSVVIDFTDKEGLIGSLKHYIKKVKDRDLEDVSGGEAFSMTNRTKELVDLIQSYT